jgi:hypothetical protein
VGGTQRLQRTLAGRKQMIDLTVRTLVFSLLFLLAMKVTQHVASCPVHSDDAEDIRRTHSLVA